MGGTFMSLSEDYKNKFIAQLHNALSGYTGTDVDEAVRYVQQASTFISRISSLIRPLSCTFTATPSVLVPSVSASRSRLDQITACVPI